MYMYRVVLVSTLSIFGCLSAPIPTCETQEPCLEFSRMPIDDGSQIEVCVSWEPNSECIKRGAATLRLMCSNSGAENDALNVASGTEICQVVDCGANAIFGIGDGKSCASSNGLTDIDPERHGIEGITCSNQPFCGVTRRRGGYINDCTWSVPAGDCPTDSPTSNPTANPTAKSTAKPTSCSSACPKIYDPVCGVDATMYPNECFANCAGVAIDCDGGCPCATTSTTTTTLAPPAPAPPAPAPPAPPAPSPCDSACPKIYDPVCSVDGTEYPNECFANCAGVAKDCDGECPCDIISTTPSPVCTSNSECPKEYRPVCGTDGTTWPNQCFADCNGAIVDCTGVCPCATASTTTTTLAPPAPAPPAPAPPAPPARRL